MGGEILFAALAVLVLIVGPVAVVIMVVRDLRRAGREEAARLGKRRFRKLIRSRKWRDG